MINIRIINVKKYKQIDCIYIYIVTFCIVINRLEVHTVSAELDISPKLAKNGFIPDTTGKSAYIPETLKSGRKNIKI